MKKILIICVLLFSLLGCYLDSTKNKTQSIIGKDNRSTYALKNNFSKSVGSFQSGDINCTGFVSAPEELTTAAHCFDGDFKVTTFSIAGKNIKILGLKEIFSKADLITFKIPLQVKYLTAGDYKEELGLSVISVNEEGTLLTDNICHRVNSSSEDIVGVIQHYCDTVGGSSGSPLLQGGKVVAVHIGTTVNHDSNIGVIISELSNVDLSNYPYELECNKWNPFCGEKIQTTKVMNVCGTEVGVSGLIYKVCQVSIATSTGACVVAGTIPDPTGSLATTCITSSSVASATC